MQLQPAEQRASGGNPPSYAHEKIRARQIELAPIVQKVAQYVHELHQRAVEPVLQRMAWREQEREHQRQGPSMTM